MKNIPTCYAETIPTIIITSALGSQSTIRVQERPKGSLSFQSSTSLSHRSPAIPKKEERTVAPAHHSASSRHTTPWTLLAASIVEHSRPAGTKSDGSLVCAIAASTRRCRWALGPGTVSLVVSVCAIGRTNSIHLAPERIDDDAYSLVAGSCVIGVADVELDCHGDLAFVAREVPAVEGNICGLHGCGAGVFFLVDFAVDFAVGFAVCFAVGFAVGFVVGEWRHV